LKGFPGRQPAGASDALKAAHSGMQVCQWQLVQINPAARALALGGRRGTGAGAAGGAWITPVVCPPGPGPGSGAAAAGAGRWRSSGNRHGLGDA